MIDLLFLAKGREEFTEASAAALLKNTDWKIVRAVYLYSDGPWSPTLGDMLMPLARNIVPVMTVPKRLGGPVAIMNHYLAEPSHASYVAKIDNDTIVPPGWLESCLSVMEAHPELDLLGIEPPESRTANPATGKRVVCPEYSGPISVTISLDGEPCSGYAHCDSVGGIGLFRRRAFEGRPLPEPGPSDDGRSGFWLWQKDHPEVTKGWVCPPLKLFLLDRLPIQPWLGYSLEYEKDPRVQREWTRYSPEAHQLWDWWLR